LLLPLLQAGPRDWLADVAHRYGMYSVLDLVNNNTQLLAPGRLDEAPVGKTLLLCDVDPKGEELRPGKVPNSLHPLLMPLQWLEVPGR
jgi:hypothetical protein